MEDVRAQVGTRLGWWVVVSFLGMALFGSGAAGLVNQVVWQRSLKVFLGGSDTTSAMIVVLVFMAGLGMGSVWMGRRCPKVKDPLRAAVLVEGLLCGVNLLICGLLGSDLGDSVYAFQRVALASGVPLGLLYAVSAVSVLIVPCFLMGATMPLAAEICQRRFGLQDSRVVGLLFFVNTLGSVVGTVIAGGYMVPVYGLTDSLIVAAGANGLAAILLVLLIRALKPSVSSVHTQHNMTASRASFTRPTLEQVLAFGLGFCALGYEMYLYRLVCLRHHPLPFTFSAVLAGYLLFWSIGAGCSSKMRRPTLSVSMRMCGILVAASVTLFVLDHTHAMRDGWGIVTFVLLRFPYFVPAWFFGYMFGHVAARAAKSWGIDIGMLYAWNTVGSCCGVVLMTYVGYEMPFYMMALILALLLFGLQEYLDGVDRPSRRAGRWRLPILLTGVAGITALTVDLSGVIPGMRMYFGRDGVIGVDDHGNMMWDGLWHSKLSMDHDHVGENNWYVAVGPLLCHTKDEIEDVCIIGLAAGISGATLAKLESVRSVDGYDINRTLKQLYVRYPEGTLRISNNPKVQILWQDARSGLALSEKKYDIIQSQPLYLKQAGSGLLNSVEFYELISRRLKPGGVFSLYSNGTAEQAFAIRQTAAAVFPHRLSMFGGYLLLLSNDPIRVDSNRLALKLQSGDPLWEEISNYIETSDPSRIVALFDDPPLDWGDGRILITDDHPVVEYPYYVTQLIADLGYDLALPIPGADDL